MTRWIEPAVVLTEPDERVWVGVDGSRDDRWIQLQVTGPLPGSGNGAFGSRLAVNNIATQMVVTGNFLADAAYRRLDPRTAAP